jgi:site-specific recombinase XerD
MVHAMAPDHDWSWVTQHPGRPSLREVRASRKLPKTFDPKALCCKALDLMDHINAGPRTHELRLYYRNALIVAMQCVFTLRRRNLAEMTLGRNLIVEDDVIHVVFTSRETKNYLPINATVPDFLKPYLLRYLDEHRTGLLAGHKSDAVWINHHHEALEYGAMNFLFASIGIRLLGFPISCHTFRHSVATAILTKDPRRLKVASGTLTHGSLRSVNTHYDLSGAAGSRKIWDKLRRDIVRGKGS